MIKNRLYIGFFLFLIAIIINAKEIDLGIAKKLYQQKHYKKACQILNKLFKDKPDNIELNLMMGKCFLSIGNLDDAMAAFDRVLILDQNNAQAHYEIARLYYINKNYNLARTELDKIDAKNIVSKKLLSKFKALSNEIENKNNIKYSTFLILGYSYNDNIYNDIGEVKYELPLLNIKLTGHSKRSDKSLFSSIYFNFNKNKNKTNCFGFDEDFLYYFNTYDKYKDNNLKYLYLRASPFYKSNFVEYRLSLIADKVIFGGNNYSHSIKLENSLKFFNNISYIKLKVAQENVFDDADLHLDMKNRYYEIIFHRNLSLAKIDLGYRYKEYRLKDTFRNDMNNNTSRYSIRFSKRLIKNLYSKISYKFEHKRYIDYDKVFKNFRKDNQKKYEISLDYYINSNLKFTIVDSYTKNSSNQPIYNYKKNVIKLYFTKTFQ